MCIRDRWCPAHDVWVDAQAAVALVLRGKTITQLAELVAARKPISIVSNPQWN